MATDVSAPLPAVELPPNSTLTVTLSDAGAKITALNVHGDQPDAGTGAGGTISNPVYLQNFSLGDMAA